MKVLIDTCVVLDYLQAREPFFDDALNVAIGAANREFDPYLSANALTDLHYIVSHSVRNTLETRRILAMLCSLFGIADTIAENCTTAVKSPIEDFGNAVMAETAARIGADYIVTRNLKDYEEPAVAAISPERFLAITLALTCVGVMCYKIRGRLKGHAERGGIACRFY